MEKRYRKMQRKVNGKIRKIGEGGVLLELPLQVAEVIGSLPQLIRELAQETGILLMLAVMNGEGVRIAGPKHSKNPLRMANWWGSDLLPVYYDKQEVIIERPRLRGKDKKEIPLATYEAFRDPQGMREAVLKNMVLGISSRDYEEAVSAFQKGYGIKKSSVSRGRCFQAQRANPYRDGIKQDIQTKHRLGQAIERLENEWISIAKGGGARNPREKGDFRGVVLSDSPVNGENFHVKCYEKFIY
jgi:hypothetical protein